MPELRRDPTSGEWVIVAAERSRRPDQFVRRKPGRRQTAAKIESCPFCPGNEHLTPPPTLELPKGHGSWRVRAFPNMYPAFAPAPSLIPASEGPLFVAVSGQGAHEVLVETPFHNRFPADRDADEMAVLVQAYQRRYTALMSLDYAKYLLVFKNQGEAAGTSLQHPHSQIIASPLVPADVQTRCEIASRHHGRTGRCLYCDIVQEELRAGRRIVHRDEFFTVFHPFAAARPAETWIVPLKHEAGFDRVDGPQLQAFGSVLGRTLKQLRKAFGDPDFNYAIHSAPKGVEDQPYYHWHLQLMPRMTKAAGLELGSGMYVNIAAPEDTAEAMRQAPA